MSAVPRLKAVLAAIVASTGLALATAGPAAAGDNTFAAIAVNTKNVSYGYGYLYPTRSAAETRALDECHIHSEANPAKCQGIAWVRNGCAAVSFKRRDGRVVRIAWGIGERKGQAARRALEAGGDNAKLLTVVCSTTGEVEKAAASAGGGGSP